MKKILITLTLVLIVPFFVFSQNPVKLQNNKSAKEKEVLSVIDKLTEAGLKRDVSAIERLYSDDYFTRIPTAAL